MSIRASTALLLPAVALAVPAAARFAPVEDRAYRLTTETARDDGATVRRFVLERDIVFHRDGSGYLADVTTLSAPDKADYPAELFSTAIRALAGVTIRYRLDRDGHVAAIDDLDKVWESTAAAIDAMPPPGDRRRVAAARLGDHLRSLPVERRRSMLASIIAPLVPAHVAPGSRDVTISGEALDGTTRVLRGQSTTQSAPGAQIVDLQASDSDSNPTVAITQTEATDLATGLLRSREERRVQRLPTEPDRQLIVTTRVTLTLKVS